MTENKRYWYDFEDCNGAKIIDFEKENEYALETIGDFRKIEDLLNEYDSELQMCREKVVYWRNKAKDTFGDMRTNVELEKENKKLKERIRELETELNAFKPAVFQDMRKGTILLYAKDYSGDVE